MLSRLTHVTLVLLSSAALLAQNTYVKTIGTSQSDYGTSCYLTSDKGTVLSIIGGSGPGGSLQMSLVKTDHNGAIQWSRSFSYGSYIYPATVVQEADKGYTVFGDLGTTTKSLFLLRTDSLGNPLWTRVYSASANEHAIELMKSRSGGYVALSTTNFNNTVGLYNYTMLMRLDSLGTVRWAREYRSMFSVEPRSVVELPGQAFAFTASAKASVAGSNHALVLKTDSMGAILWSRLYETLYEDDPLKIACTPNGDIFVAGASAFVTRAWDGFLLKLNAQGQRLFNTFYDAGTMQGEFNRTLIAREDGTCLLLGDVGTYDERDITLLSVNAQGYLQWARRYPLSVQFTNYPYDVHLTYNNGLVFTGDVRPPTYSRDALLVKTDAQGNTACLTSPMAYTVHHDSMQLRACPTWTAPITPTLTAATLVQPTVFVSAKTTCENPLPVVDFDFLSDSACPQTCANFYDRTLNAANSWIWSFPQATPSQSSAQYPQNICYPSAGTYPVSLTVSNAYGTSAVTKMITISNNCPEQPIEIPNVFTPNGDGSNDGFFIKGLPERFSLKIYNRWGEELFSSSEKNKVWQGRTKTNEEVPQGVYYYWLSANNRVYTGFVHVFR